MPLRAYHARSFRRNSMEKSIDRYTYPNPLIGIGDLLIRLWFYVFSAFSQKQPSKMSCFFAVYKPERMC